MNRSLHISAVSLGVVALVALAPLSATASTGVNVPTTVPSLPVSTASIPAVVPSASPTPSGSSVVTLPSVPVSTPTAAPSVGALTVPLRMSAPTIVQQADGSVTSTWAAASDLVASLVSGYRLTEAINGVVANSVVLPVSATSYVSARLADGTRYATQILALNTLGAGLPSETSNLVTVSLAPNTSTDVGSGSGNVAAATGGTSASSTGTSATTSGTSSSAPAASGVASTGTAPSTPSTATPTSPTQAQPTAPSTPPAATPTQPRASSTPAPTTSTKPAPVAGPSQLHLTALTPAKTAVSFSWRPSRAESGAKISAYTFRLYKGKQLVRISSVPAKRLSHRLTGLRSHTAYTLRTMAVSSRGKVSKLATDNFRTR